MCTRAALITAICDNGCVVAPEKEAVIDDELAVSSDVLGSSSDVRQPSVTLVVTTGRRRNRVLLVAAEVVLSLGAAAGLTAWCASIDVNPLVRIGQVSGLAGMQLRFAALGIAMIAVLIGVARVVGPSAVPVVTRLGSATLAGLTSGLLGGGVIVALRGTDLPLSGGDFITISNWAKSIVHGHSTLQSFYPPLPVYTLAWFSEATGVNVEFAFKDLQIVGAALFGPVAYLSWRLLLRPLPALAIGVVAALPMVELYKPYENLVLIALIPLLAKLLQYVRSAPDRSYRQLVPVGVLFGLALGLCFLSYSGWFVWSAPGFVAGLLIVFPWRRGPLRALTVVVAAVGSILALCWPQISALLTASNSVKDTYFYFATSIDPTYIAMWQGPPPGDTTWPPVGELAGVGLFSVVLFAGLAAALFLGLRRSIVVTAVCCVAGAWLLRFYYASQMYQQHAVQLYPRTTIEILYCLLILTLFAALLGWERLRERVPGLWQSVGKVVRGGVLPAGVIGAFCALLLLLGSAGSETVNGYLPHVGDEAWVGQTTRMPDGHCSAYLAPNCKTVIDTKPNS